MWDLLQSILLALLLMVMVSMREEVRSPWTHPSFLSLFLFHLEVESYSFFLLNLLKELGVVVGRGFLCKHRISIILTYKHPTFNIEAMASVEDFKLNQKREREVLDLEFDFTLLMN